MTDEQDAAITAQEARAKRAPDSQAFNDALWLTTFSTVLSDCLNRGDLISVSIDCAVLWADEIVTTRGRKA